MSFYAKDSTIEFKWSIPPTDTPPVISDFDITLIIPGNYLPPITPYITQILEDNPIAYYKLNELSGDALDSSGNNRDCTVSGDVTRAQTSLVNASNIDTGGCYSFGGNDTGRLVSTDSVFQLKGDLTIEAWFHLINHDNQGWVMQQQAIADDQVQFNFHWSMLIGPDGKITAFHEFGPGTNDGATTTDSHISLNTTHHVVITRDSTAKTYSFYVDGVFIETLSYVSNPTDGLSSTMWIGAHDKPNAEITGRIDEVAIYDYELTSDRISDHYTSGVSIFHATYIDDEVTSYIAPTATEKGEVTYDLALDLVGLYKVTLSIGTKFVHIVSAQRQVFSVSPPDHVIFGRDPCITQGPTNIPPEAPFFLDISRAFEPNPLKTIYIEPQNNNPVGAWVSDDGLHAYVSRGSVEFVWQYDMSTPFDLSTAVYSGKAFAYDGVGGSPDFGCFNFRVDGLKYWIAQSSSIFAYSMSVAWDISTSTIDNVNHNISSDLPGNGSTAIGNALHFKSDGTEMYIYWQQSQSPQNSVATWKLSTAWDISTAVLFSQTGAVFLAQGNAISAHMTPDGLHWVTDVKSVETLFQYDMSVPYDASTIVYSGLSWDYGLNMPSLDGSFQGFWISADAKHIFFIDSSANDDYIQADIA